MRARRGAGYVLVPGATRASWRATGHVQGWVLEHLPSSKVGGTYVADAAAGKAIDAGEPASNGVIEVPAPLRRLQLLTHSSHQLLHPHVERRCQGDEGAQARIHRGCRGGTLPSRTFGGCRWRCQRRGPGLPGPGPWRCGRGYMRRVLAVEAERLDDSIAQSRRFLTDRLAEALRHRSLLIPPEGVIEERRQQPRTKQRPTQLTQRKRVQPLPLTQLQRSKPRVEHHEEDASQGEGDGQKGGLQTTEAVVEG